jgi:hypothetical protein
MTRRDAVSGPDAETFRLKTGSSPALRAGAGFGDRVVQRGCGPRRRRCATLYLGSLEAGVRTKLFLSNPGSPDRAVPGVPVINPVPDPHAGQTGGVFTSSLVCLQARHWKYLRILLIPLISDSYGEVYRKPAQEDVGHNPTKGRFCDVFHRYKSQHPAVLARKGQTRRA